MTIELAVVGKLPRRPRSSKIRQNVERIRARCEFEPVEASREGGGNDSATLAGKWCTVAHYDNLNSAAHQAWRLRKFYEDDPHWEFRSKRIDNADGARRHHVLVRYLP